MREEHLGSGFGQEAEATGDDSLPLGRLLDTVHHISSDSSEPNNVVLI